MYVIETYDSRGRFRGVSETYLSTEAVVAKLVKDMHKGREHHISNKYGLWSYTRMARLVHLGEVAFRKELIEALKREPRNQHSCHSARHGLAPAFRQRR